MVYVGIDIGTTNTVVATSMRGEEPEVYKIDSESLVPSLITVREKGGNLHAGLSAADDWADPDSDSLAIFRRWKLQIGDEVTLRSMQFGGSEGNSTHITPEWLTTRLVEYVLGTMNDGIGGENIDTVLVTVPHGWRRDTPEKCLATRSSAEAAVVNDKPVAVHKTTVSEPVAAAVYAVWKGRQAGHDFTGRQLLVIDVGGGTMDLSLVRAGTEKEPLVVIDAINNNNGGDTATALLIARAAAACNEEHGTDYSVDPETILEDLTADADPRLRSWFIELQKAKSGMTSRIRTRLKRGDQIDGCKEYVHLITPGADDDDFLFTLTGPDFVEALAPYYESGRDLLRTFFKRHQDEAPYAVIFAGGGSRLHGLRTHVAEPVLAELFTPQAAQEALDRAPVNDRRIDQAIALGAALVAAGTVTVEERLLSDVGLVAEFDSLVAGALGISADTAVLISPMLKQGSLLPARFSTEGMSWYVGAGNLKDVEVAVVIDDDPVEPWKQEWTIPAPSGREKGCAVEISADSDGVLSVTLRFLDDASHTLNGRLSRTRSGRGRLRIHAGVEQQPDDGFRRVTPEQVAAAISKVGPGRKRNA